MLAQGGGMRRANYAVVNADVRAVTIRDLGPWNQFLTVTNDVEAVVRELVATGHLIEGQRLFCEDSEGQLDELLVKNGEFAGFRCGAGP